MNKFKNNKFGKKWLNVASGFYTLDDFINIDNSVFLKLLPLYPLIKYFLTEGRKKWFENYLKAKNSNHVLIRANCRKDLPFEDNSIDHILCSHFLEHIYYEEAEKVLHGFYRILKPNGTLHLIVPDLNSRIEKYANSDSDNRANEFIDSLIFNYKSRPSFLVNFLEFTGNFGLFHRWMYNQDSFEGLVKQIGFTILDKNESQTATWRADNNHNQINIIVKK